MPALALIRDWSALQEWADPASAVATSDWRRLFRLGPPQSMAGGTCLFSQSSNAQTIYLIKSGIVKLSRASSAGKTVAILLRFPSDIVGAYGALLQLPHFVSATAVTDCQTVTMSVPHLLGTCRSNAEAACFLAQRQTIDAARISSLLIESRILTAEQRLFRLLLQLGTATTRVRLPGPCMSVSVPLNESEIAELIGMNRSAFSRLKRTLIRNCNLRQNGNVFTFRRNLVGGILA